MMKEMYESSDDEMWRGNDMIRVPHVLRAENVNYNEKRCPVSHFAKSNKSFLTVDISDPVNTQKLDNGQCA